MYTEDHVDPEANMEKRRDTLFEFFPLFFFLSFVIITFFNKNKLKKIKNYTG